MRTTTAKKIGQVLRLLSCLPVLLVSAHLAQAQVGHDAMGLCFNGSNKTVTVRGGIGGEAHDSYVFHATEGRKVTVHIRSTSNRADFTISKTEFGEPVNFGTATNGGKKWTGTIPESGAFFISVVAHPDARYVLKVTKR